MKSPNKMISKEQITDLLKFCNKPVNSLFWRATAIRLILYMRNKNKNSEEPNGQLQQT